MITTNLKFVMGEIDKYGVETIANTKLTRDELARTAQVIMKKELSHKRSYTGRGASKKYNSTVAGAPPSKVSGTLFRSIKSRKWDRGGTYGAYVGLPKSKRGYGDAYYGVILESSNRTGKGNAFSGKRRVLAGGRVSGKGAYPQRAPGVHKWALPAFLEFEPLVNPIVQKNMGGR